MRTRNREVNIFNMSLLDILTGMMGAFLFLMLGLVPYYMKTQNQKTTSAAAGGGGSQIPTIRILEVSGHWYSPTKVGIFLYGPNHDPSFSTVTNTWWSNNPSNPILHRSGPVTNLGTGGGTGWQSDSTSVQPNERYLVAFEVPEPGKDGLPKDYSRLGFTIDLLITEPSPEGKSNTRYVPVMLSFVKNASRAKPGTVYGAFWITTTEDTSKIWYSQDSYKTTPISMGEDDLPPGVFPLSGIEDQLPMIEDTSQLSGIGVSVTSDAQPNPGQTDQITDHLLIKEVVPNGPAAKSGLQVGDEIIQINGLNVAGRKFNEVVQNWLRGKTGSPVQISVRRSGEQDLRSFVVERVPMVMPGGH